jgi:Matrixin
MRVRRFAKSLWVAACSALAIAFLSVRADGFCRAVTLPPPAGYDPALSGCFDPQVNPKTDGGVSDLYWKNACVGYSLQRDASKQVTLDQATRIAAQAFAAWSVATCNGGGSPSIAAINEGPVQCSRVEYNSSGANQHVIVFRDDGWPYQDPSNTLGLTTLTVNLDTGEIDDADIEINSHDFTFTVDGAPADAGGASYDLLGILTHEAGHFLGLAHSDDKNAVMYAHYSPNAAAITPDDVAGICAIDGPDNTRSTSRGTVMADSCNAMQADRFSTQCADASVAAASTITCPPSIHCSIARSPARSALVPGMGAFVALMLIARRRARGGASRTLSQSPYFFSFS